MLDINSFQFFYVLNVKNFIIIVLLTIYGISIYIFNTQCAYFYGKFENFLTYRGALPCPGPWCAPLCPSPFLVKREGARAPVLPLATGPGQTS